LLASDSCPVLHEAADQAGLTCEAFPPITPGGRPGWLFQCRDDRQVFAPLVPLSLGTWRRFVGWLDSLDLAGPLTGEPYRHLSAIKPNLSLIYRLLQQLCRQQDAAAVLRGAWDVGLPWELIDAGDATPRAPELPQTPAGWLPRSSLVVGTPPLWPCPGSVPERGQHTAEILVAELGYSPDLLKDLAADSVI
ncbi:MAG TPA: hypothetical protein VHL09_08115, partial [Dehalococcoidia bacterium]|nr:hypothetical protein [Dehalococcoidia bacterium]